MSVDNVVCLIVVEQPKLMRETLTSFSGFYLKAH